MRHAKRSLVIYFFSLIVFCSGQNNIISHFDFVTYPDLNAVLAKDPVQPKQTGQSSSIRYSIVFPDLICTLAEAKILRVKVIIPSGSTNLDFQLQIWRRNPDETYTLSNTITKVFTTAGTFNLLDGTDFSNKMMKFNDLVGLWTPWKYPVAALSGPNKNVMFIARYTGPGSNTLDQNPPSVGNKEVVSATGDFPYRMAVEVELEDQSGGTVTVVYLSGVKGEKGVMGQAGAPGSQGVQGGKGVKGTVGSIGEKGLKGDAGDQGDDGIYTAGATGSTGLVGDKGVIGSPGEPGSKGDPGNQGSPGVKGGIGATGSTGATGRQGDKGLKGEPGVMGLQGQVGTTGDQGDRGDKGEKGEQGEKGDRGPSGRPLPAILSENTACSDFTLCKNSVCVDTLIGPSCECLPGYKYSNSSVYECEDLNECLQGRCTQLCVNTEGSYECSCVDGFTLKEDGKSCEAQVTDRCADCDENESCELIGYEKQCLPSGVAITYGNEALVSAGPQTNEETSMWINEEWIIIFIVWSIILSVVTIIVIVWLVYEYKVSKGDKPDESVNHSQQTSVINGVSDTTSNRFYGNNRQSGFDIYD